MRKRLIGIAWAMAAIFSVATLNPAMAGLPHNTKPVRRKPEITQLRNFKPNRIATDMNNRGAFVSWDRTGNAGMEWPAGSGKTILFAGGIWVGGMVNRQVRTAVAEFAYEFVPGPILPGGTIDPDNERYRIYIITRTDVENAGYENPNSPPGEDYLNWPVDLGAPVDREGKPLLLGDAAAWTLFNDLDVAAHANVFNSKPLGIEVQSYFWGFDRADAFGDMLFLKYSIINKSSTAIDSTFIAFWTDPDLGDASDDFVGVDTTLDLGYCWNDGPDRVYGVRAPAIGMDFFQGPIVPSPGDTAFVSGKRIPGFRNLRLTAFAKYIGGGGLEWGDPESAEEAYNYMNGQNRAGEPYIDPNTGNELKFAHPGDPVTGEGWIDPQSHNSGDRRFLMSSGPFTLAAGDTQEVVGGVLIARAFNNLESITELRKIDRAAQAAYNRNFRMPKPPPVPNVHVSELDREIVLTWDDAAESYDEPDLIGRIRFQGYNIYQVGGWTRREDVPFKRIAYYDIIDGNFDGIYEDYNPPYGGDGKLLQPLGDTGIKRFFRTTKDFLTGKPLINGRTYWFVVTAFGYNPDAVTAAGMDKILESPIRVLHVTPQAAPIHQELPTTSGQIIAARTADTTFNIVQEGPGDGRILVEVLDPKAITGLDYSISFEKIDYDLVWHLDRSDGERVLAYQTNQAGDDDYMPVDGLLVRVADAPPAFAGDGDGIIEVAFSGLPLTEDQYDSTGARYGGNTVWHSLNHANDIDRYYVSAGGGYGSMRRLTRYIAYAAPRDFEFRFTKAGGFGVFAFENDLIAATPFEIWDVGIATVGDTSDDKRMIPFLLSNEDPAAEWGWATGTDAALGSPASDWVYWMDPDPATNGYADFAEVCTKSGGAGATYDFNFDTSIDDYYVDFHGGFVYPIGRVIFCDYDGNGAPPPAGTTVRFITEKPNSPQVTYTFSTAGFAPKVLDVAVAQQKAAAQVNVFPNPYYGRNVEETDMLNRFVTFTHLPEDVASTIRIFGLSGELVKKIVHEPGSQFERWDLRNAATFPVASGIYIALIDMGKYGVKVLKIAVFMPEERLDAI